MRKYKLYIDKVVYADAENENDAVKKYLDGDVKSDNKKADVDVVYEVINVDVRRVCINECRRDKPTIIGTPVKYDGKFLVLKHVIIEDIEFQVVDKVKVALDDIDEIFDI